MIATTDLIKRSREIHAELVAMNTQFNGFLSGDYEVRFLQDDRLTVCVIRNLHKLDERYTGVSVLNPKDEFYAAIGRHKAFKKALEGLELPITHINPENFTFVNWALWHKYQKNMNINQLQQDYWKRYGAEEK